MQSRKRKKEKSMSQKSLIAVQNVEQIIRVIRDQKVILDQDLAVL